MEEKFLHFVWSSIGFDPRNLETVDGLPVKIHGKGALNPNQGPDFLGARIQIGYPQFAGAVEIHCQTEDWFAHGHEKDPRYNTVILHVVGRSSGKKVYRQDGSVVPELSLEGLIPAEVWKRYTSMSDADSGIHCRNLLEEVDELTKATTLDALGVERMQVKAGELQERKKSTVHHWQQMVWEELSRAMGGKVNGEAFAEMASRVPIEWVSKLRGNRVQLEGMLLGVLGLLPEAESEDSYIREMQEAWWFFRVKYSMGYSPIQVRYLRMRPNSFPPIRISQLAGILNRYPTVIELMLEGTMADFLETEIEASEYWESHTKVGESSSVRKKRMGKDLKRSIIINALLPMAGLYYEQHGLDTFRETAVNILEKFPAEDNQVVRMFELYGIQAGNALRSQGVLQLKKSYCDLKKCLNCRLGQKILLSKTIDNGANTYRNRGNRGRGQNRNGYLEPSGGDRIGLPDHGGG